MAMIIDHDYAYMPLSCMHFYLSRTEAVGDVASMLREPPRLIYRRRRLLLNDEVIVFGGLHLLDICDK